MKKKSERSIVNKLLDDLIDDEQDSSPGELGSEDPSVFEVDEVTSDNVLDITGVVMEGSELKVPPDLTVQPNKSEKNSDEVDHTIEIKNNQTNLQPQEGHGSEDATMAVPLSGSPTSTFNETQTRHRVGVGRFHGHGAGVGASSTDAMLSQSEALRIAQQRITEVEEEVERLREENEGLAAAGEAISKHVDELKAKLARAEVKNREMEERFTQERETLLEAIRVKDQELERRRIKQEEFDARLSSNLKKVRVRERELENRLELVKMEGSALLRNKDEIILDMKRQLDQAQQEIESYRSKGQDLGRQLSEKQETLRRTVKALRLALSMMDGESESGSGSGEKAS